MRLFARKVVRMATLSRLSGGYGVQNGYIVYGEHVSMIAEQFCKTRDVVRSAENTEIITLNRTLFEAVLKEYLLDSTAFKIEIYEESFGGWLLKK